MTVVVLAGETLPAYVLCERQHGGWAIVDHDEEIDADSVPRPPPIALSPDERSIWFSTVNDDAPAHGTLNVGVEFTCGSAPGDAVEALLRDERDEFRAPVEGGVYWLVRWEVPDPADRDGIELVAFRDVDGRILRRWGI